MLQNCQDIGVVLDELEEPLNEKQVGVFEGKKKEQIALYEEGLAHQ